MKEYSWKLDDVDDQDYYELLSLFDPNSQENGESLGDLMKSIMIS